MIFNSIFKVIEKSPVELDLPNTENHIQFDIYMDELIQQYTT